MIRSFADAATEDLFNGVHKRQARQACSSALRDVVARTLTQLNRVRELRKLAILPGNRLEALTGLRRGQHSIRINDQFRTPAGLGFVACVAFQRSRADCTVEAVAPRWVTARERALVLLKARRDAV